MSAVFYHLDALTAVTAILLGCAGILRALLPLMLFWASSSRVPADKRTESGMCEMASCCAAGQIALSAAASAARWPFECT